jgi:ABC-type branched-subunit amino acid transport system ATPase component
MALLEVEKVGKSFGGLRAMSGVSLTVNEGEIVSVIGPNGAGKTTLFNLITGVYKPDEGDIRFKGRSIAGLKPNKIVDLGVARTFQNLRLFTHLTILENVLIAQHHKLNSTWLSAVLRLPGYRRQEQQMREFALEKLAFFGPRLMSFRLHQPVYVLSYANRRRTEMARAMATGAKLLLLDEPSAGMNPKETREITQIIRRMRDEGGYTILLVEHKMNLVGEISDRVVVLDYGQKLAEGSYKEVVNDPKVIEAYLGKKATEAEESEIARAAKQDGRVAG